MTNQQKQVEDIYWKLPYQCKKCGCRFENPSTMAKHARTHDPRKHPTKFLYKGKIIDAGKTVRTGICSNCGKKGYTHLHHDYYNDDDPLEGTRELCATCHGIETKKQFGLEIGITSKKAHELTKHNI